MRNMLSCLPDGIGLPEQGKRNWRCAALVIGASLLVSPAALAQKKYDTGASDTEIKLGQTMPYSGPASSFAPIGRVLSGYFKMVNERQIRINGRKVNLIPIKNAYNPGKKGEHTRKRVEGEGSLT